MRVNETDRTNMYLLILTDMIVKTLLYFRLVASGIVMNNYNFFFGQLLISSCHGSGPR